MPTTTERAPVPIQDQFPLFNEQQSIHQAEKRSEASIRGIVDAVSNGIAPTSLEVAEQIVEGVTELDKSVQLKGEEDGVAPETRQALHHVALRGIDTWRLDEAGRSLWAQGTQVSNPKHLPKPLRDHMERISPADKQESLNEKVARLRTDAANRLKLDDAIKEKYGNDDLPKQKKTQSKSTKPGKGVSHRNDEIADLVELDASGRARYKNAHEVVAVGLDRKTAVTKNISGRFMSRHELDLIKAHQDQIRDGLETRDSVVPQYEPRHAKKTDEAEQRALVSEELEKAGSKHFIAGGGTKEEWEAFSEEQKAQYLLNAARVEFEQLLSGQEPAEIERQWQLLTPAERLRMLEADAPDGNDVPKVAPEDLQDGGNRRLAKVWPWARNAKRSFNAHVATATTLPVEYYKGLSRRKKIAGAVLGATAVAIGVGVIIAKVKQGEAPTGASQTQMNFIGSEHADIAAQAAAKAERAKEHVETFVQGDNPWDVSKDQLQSYGIKHPSNEQIAAVNNANVKLSHIDVATGQDRKLPVGFKMKTISKNAVEKLLRIKLS